MMEEDRDTLVACWTALGAVINSIPKELQPSYVRTMRDAVQVSNLTSCSSFAFGGTVSVTICQSC